MACCEADGTFGVNDVPSDFREFGIVSGYRRPGLTFRQCIRSLFTLHNETFNVWTHIFPFIFYVYYTITQPIDFWLPENQPIFCLFLVCCIYPIGSAIAHLFNSMSSTLRHICFMLDYMTISLYAYGACITNKVYGLPKSMQGGWFEKYYLSLMLVSCAIGVFTSCYTRFLTRSKTTKILRLSAFALPYFTGMLPCMHRAMFCEDDNSCLAASYYTQHFVDMFFSIVFYGTHIPEVIFPGYFDIFFQSHSIFHVIVARSTYSHLQGTLIDLNTRHPTDFAPMPISPLITLACIAIINSLIVAYLGLKISRVVTNSSDTNLSNKSE